MTRTLMFTALFMVIAAGAFAIDEEMLTTGNFISPTSYDARARSLGHTEITTALGANSIFYNPANLALNSNKSFEAGFRFTLFGSIKDDQFDADPDVDISAKYKMHPKFTDIAFGMPIPMSNPNMKLAVGLGYNTYFDWGYSGKMEATATGGSLTREQKLHGGLNMLTPAIAVGFQDKYFFGVAVSKSIMSNVSLDEEVTIDPDPDQDSWTEEDDAKLSGTIFTIGATARPTPEFTVGAIFRSGFTQKLTDIKWTYTPAGGTAENGEEGDIEAKQKAIIGFGASYQLSPMVLVSAEFQTRKFLDIVTKQLPDPDNPGGDTDFDTTTTIKNGNCFRLGIEYKTSSFPIRLGFFSDAIGVRDEVGDEWWLKAEKPKSLSGLTGGIGFAGTSFNFDLFAEYAFWSMKYDDDLGGGVKTYEHKESIFTIGTSVAYNLK